MGQSCSPSPSHQFQFVDMQLQFNYDFRLHLSDGLVDALIQHRPSWFGGAGDDAAIHFLCDHRPLSRRLEIVPGGMRKTVNPQSGPM